MFFCLFVNNEKHAHSDQGYLWAECTWRLFAILMLFYSNGLLLVCLCWLDWPQPLEDPSSTLRSLLRWPIRVSCPPLLDFQQVCSRWSVQWCNGSVGVMIFISFSELYVDSRDHFITAGCNNQMGYFVRRTLISRTLYAVLSFFAGSLLSFLMEKMLQKGTKVDFDLPTDINEEKIADLHENKSMWLWKHTESAS